MILIHHLQLMVHLLSIMKIYLKHLTVLNIMLVGIESRFQINGMQKSTKQNIFIENTAGGKVEFPSYEAYNFPDTGPTIYMSSTSTTYDINDQLYICILVHRR